LIDFNSNVIELEFEGSGRFTISTEQITPTPSIGGSASITVLNQLGAELGARVSLDPHTAEETIEYFLGITRPHGNLDRAWTNREPNPDVIASFGGSLFKGFGGGFELSFNISKYFRIINDIELDGIKNQYQFGR
jgi:hypothetical protein